MLNPIRSPWTGQTGWHRAKWGVLGWTETAVKLAAIAIAVVAAASGGQWRVPPTHAPAFWLLTAIAVGYLGTVIDRWVDREIVAATFVVLVLVGHWSLVFAMGGPVWPHTAINRFAGLMLAGDLVKLAYFVQTGARVRDIPRAAPIAMTMSLAVVYGVALFLA